MLLRGFFIFLFLVVAEVKAITPNKYCQSIPTVACEVLNISDPVSSNVTVQGGSCTETIRTFTVRYCKLGVFYQAPIRQTYGIISASSPCSLWGSWGVGTYYNSNVGVVTSAFPGVASFETPMSGSCP